MNLVVELIKVIDALALLLHQHSRSLAIDRGYRCQELQQATISSGQGWTRKKEIRSWIACRLEFTSDPTVSETCVCCASCLHVLGSRVFVVLSWGQGLVYIWNMRDNFEVNKATDDQAKL